MNTITYIITDHFSKKAEDLRDTFIEKDTAETARAYLGFIESLNLQYHNPNPKILNRALDLVVEELELVKGLKPADKIINYKFFKNIAEMYNLYEKVEVYYQEILSLE